MQLYPLPKRTLVSLIVLAIVGLMPVAGYLRNPQLSTVGGVSSDHRLVPFNSYTELHRFLLTKSCNDTVYTSSSMGSVSIVPTSGATDMTAGKSLNLLNAANPSSDRAYSQTNDQVSGVDELDTVKTDGQYLYTVTNNTVAIVLAYPTTQARAVAYLSLNGSIQGMFILGNHLVVVTQEPNYKYPLPLGLGGPTGMGISSPVIYPWRPWPPPTTSLWMFDVSDHSRPILTTSLVVNGTLTGSRLVGNNVYLIASASIFCDHPILLPVTIVNNKPNPPILSQVYHSDIAESFHTFTSIVSVDISKTNPDPTVKILVLGTSNTIYVAAHDIFLTQPVWNQTQTTTLHRIRIDLGTITYEATGSVSGHTLNQFSMDQYNGYFRIATAKYGSPRMLDSSSRPQPVASYVQETNLYVLDNALHVHGKLEGIGPGESFYAARFVGERAYLVTFQRVDPLFVIGLQDPDHPRILGELKIPGVSDYLQPYDENHLIGFGQSPVNATWEKGSVFQQLKLSLFDVGDPNHAIESSKYLTGDYASDSQALWDHRAILLDHSLNLLVIPVEVDLYLQQNNAILPCTFPSSEGRDVIPKCAQFPPVWQGAYVFEISSESGIVFRGGITHLKGTGGSGGINTNNFVTRTMYIGNVLYTISNNIVKLNSISDLSEIGLVQLSP